MDSEAPKHLQNEAGSFATELHTWRLKCEHQATLILRLEEEIDGLRNERKDYMEGLKEKRKELALFQGKLDDAASEIADLRRAVIRAQDTQSHRHIPEPPGPQMPLTPPAPPNPDPVVVINNEEVQDLGSSSVEVVSEMCVQPDPAPNTDMNSIPPPVGAGEGSKRQPTPRMVPFVSLPLRASSIKHERPRTDPEESQAAETSTDNPARSPKRRKVETAAAPRQLRSTAHRLQTPLSSPATDTNVVSSHPATPPVIQHTGPKETRSTEKSIDLARSLKRRKFEEAIAIPRQPRVMTHGLQTSLPVPATGTVVVSSRPAISPITQRTDPGETQAIEIQTGDLMRSSRHRTVDTTATPRQLRATTHMPQTPLSGPSNGTVTVPSRRVVPPTTQNPDPKETQATERPTDLARSPQRSEFEAAATPRQLRATTHMPQTPLSSPSNGTVTVPSRRAVPPITQNPDPKETQATERPTNPARSPQRREFEATATPRQLRATNHGPQTSFPSPVTSTIVVSSRPAIPPTTQPPKERIQAAESSADLARPPKHRKPEAKAISSQPIAPINRPQVPLSSPVASTPLVPSSPAISHDADSISPITSPSRLRLVLRPPKAQAKPEVKPKLKDEAFVVPQSFVSEHLKLSKPLQINPPPSEIYVPRRFIRSIYGGNDQRLVQKIGSHRNPSGPTERRAMFPMYDTNPSMPCKPGEPGLMYASRLDLTKDSPYSLFASDLASKRAVWTYLGEYESTRCGTMGPNLFKNQKQEAKNAWGALIRDGKQWDIYVAMRARIALRKAKLSIPIEKVSEEMANIRANNGRPVSVEDVIAAFEGGAEAIDIIKMQCVAYDHTFANDLEAKFKVWDAPAARMQRQSLRGKRKAVRRNGGIESDGNEGGGPGQSSDHTRRTQNRWDSTTGARTLLTPDGAFDSDLTEYNYASSVSVE